MYRNINTNFRGLTYKNKQIKNNIMDEKLLPKIKFEESEGSLYISGVSMMENALDYYSVCKNSIDTYLSNSENKVIIDFNLSYFNSSSAKQFIQLLSKIENNKGKAIWRYPENNTILHDRGRELEILVDVEFEFIPE